MDRHLESKQHGLNLAQQKRRKKEAEEELIHVCSLCDYSTTLKTNLRKHLLTEKHKMTEALAAASTRPIMSVEMMELMLRHHSESLRYLADSTEKQQLQQSELIKTLTERLVPTQNVMLENVVQNVTNTNCNNKKFNLNFFLNEECKDAMNLSDFVKNVVITLEDLEHLGEVGYAAGMTDIITKALRHKEMKDRPLHCSDIKREVMYIRENDAWKKDHERQETLRAIERISNKNYKAFMEWRRLHPDHVIQDSSEYDAWSRISQSMCGGCNETNLNKVVHNLALATAIDKSGFVSGGDPH
jgi:hypothetical protein